MAAASRVAAKTARSLESLFEMMEAVKSELAALRQEQAQLRKELAGIKAQPNKEAKRG